MADSTASGSMPEDRWWYCVRHHTVESDADRCKAADRLGPYETRDEAEHALERVAARNEEWDREEED